MNNQNYIALDNQYLNTGGNNMVTEVTVYDVRSDRTIYVTIDHDSYMVTKVPFANVDDDNLSEVNSTLKIDEGSTDIDFNEMVNDRKNSFSELLSYCYQRHIANHCRYTNRHMYLSTDILPVELYNMLDADYIKWLDANHCLVETDGNNIFISPLYNK